MTEQKRKIEKLTGVKGMNDILPQDAGLWEFFEATVKSLLRAYGYQNIRTPIVEHTQLFTRGIGEVTDIVEKEMYSFTDALNGENLTMRPENTAAVVRASIEHNMLYDGPKRLWYIGPMFRHERPQRGRYRQFHQVGVEALGFAGPDADAEIIMMCQRLWDDLGLTGIKLEINSLGLAEERAAHRVELIKYLEQFADVLDEDAKRRLYTNPLRVLDTKNPALQEIAQNAPKLIDFLGEESRAHFEGLQRLLLAVELFKAPLELQGHVIKVPVKLLKFETSGALLDAVAALTARHARRGIGQRLHRARDKPVKEQYDRADERRAEQQHERHGPAQLRHCPPQPQLRCRHGDGERVPAKVGAVVAQKKPVGTGVRQLREPERHVVQRGFNLRVHRERRERLEERVRIAEERELRIGVERGIEKISRHIELAVVL